MSKLKETKEVEEQHKKMQLSRKDSIVFKALEPKAWCLTLT